MIVVPGDPEELDETSYAAAAQLLTDLPARLAAGRERRGLTVKQAAAAAGVTASTLSGLEAGSNCTRSTAAAVLRWLAS